jgi:uncharacterized protein YuzE
MTYDADADAAFVYLVDAIDAGQVAQTQMCDLEIPEGAVILAMDVHGHLLGVEILGASRLLSAETLAAARASGPGSS